jgi:hypothetical protein
MVADLVGHHAARWKSGVEVIVIESLQRVKGLVRAGLLAGAAR